MTPALAVHFQLYYNLISTVINRMQKLQQWLHISISGAGGD